MIHLNGAPACLADAARIQEQLAAEIERWLERVRVNLLVRSIVCSTQPLSAQP
jgi:hypothetical protein